MLAIVAYALGVMYTPGPVNLLGLNAGLQGQARASLGFYLGVGLAMLILFLLFGWAGAAWVQDDMLAMVGALGCGYILYLAIKIARSSIDLGAVRQAPREPQNPQRLQPGDGRAARGRRGYPWKAGVRFASDRGTARRLNQSGRKPCLPQRSITPGTRLLPAGRSPAAGGGRVRPACAAPRRTPGSGTARTGSPRACRRTP